MKGVGGVFVALNVQYNLALTILDKFSMKIFQQDYNNFSIAVIKLLILVFNF